MRETANRRRRLYEVISEITEMPADAVSSIPTLTLRGLHEFEADGCDGILEYSDTRVVLSCSRFVFPNGSRRITVGGTMLTLSDFSDGVLFVRGNIDSVVIGEE